MGMENVYLKKTTCDIEFWQANLGSQTVESIGRGGIVCSGGKTCKKLKRACVELY